MSKPIDTMFAVVSEHLERIQRCFMPGTKVLVIAINPADDCAAHCGCVMIGDADYDDVIRAIRHHKEMPEYKPKPIFFT